jgi:hypothetical protein
MIIMSKTTVNSNTTNAAIRSETSIVLRDLSDDRVLGTAEVNADGTWQKEVTLTPDSLHRIVAETSAAKSGTWAITQVTPPPFTEDFSTVPLQVLPIGQSVDLGKFSVLNLVNSYKIPNSIGTPKDSNLQNRCLTISGRLAIILKYKNARRFSFTTSIEYQAPNIFRFYDAQGLLLSTEIPIVSKPDYRWSVDIANISKIEIETVLAQPGVIDYIELDNISVEY